MPKSKDHRLPTNISSKCVKCGTCHSVCPVFDAVPTESHTARGKMALIEAVAQGRLEESERYRDYLEACLLCGACQEACPNEVPTLAAMLEARESLAGRMGLKTGKGMILNHLLATARGFRLAMRTGRAVQGLMFRRIPESSGLRRRFPLPLIPEDRTIPGVARDFFTDLYTGTVRTGSGPRVGIFAGCMTNYFYPETGADMVDLLGMLGATVVVPEGQVCCGMPALAGGARDTVRDLAMQNLEAFEEYDLDAIVTGCASCGGNLKDNFRALLAEAGASEPRIEAFLSKVMDINEYLARMGLPSRTGEGADEEAGREPLTVTYHHPCHLGRLQGVKEEPVRLIQALPGVRYVPMEEADRCCGMGGSFSIENYDISKRINDRKVDRILETGAQAVVTSCPACILHIRDGLRRRGRADVEVHHVAELITRRMEEEEVESGKEKGESGRGDAETRGRGEEVSCEGERGG
ncbi:MAG: (Fe-S)-binding protein [bacterium]|nr:MAG: (Fe-S)-binding protein [bacterium]